VHPDGRWAVFADFGFGRVSWLDLRDIELQSLTTTQAHTQTVTAVRFSRSGRLCLTASLDGTVCVWDSGSRRVRSVVRLRGTTIHDAVFTDDEQRLLTADGLGRVKCWPVDPLPASEQYLGDLARRSR
jgi:WD40 repeat protein